MGTAGHDASSGGDSLRPTPRGDSALLFTSSIQEGGTCVGFAAGEPATDVACLTVTLNGSVDGVVDEWERHAGGRPADLAVVSVGETTRSAAAASGGGDRIVDLTDGIKTAAVTDASDLTGLGIRISQCLRAWEDEVDRRIVVCFDSLTSLLQFADIKRVFRFLHVLTSRIRKAGARAHFHVHPVAHDEQTLATLRSLFDVTYEQDDGGEWVEP
jgi:hypothetical protein